jgi:hypothetical protein
MPPAPLFTTHPVDLLPGESLTEFTHMAESPSSGDGHMVLLLILLGSALLILVMFVLLVWISLRYQRTSHYAALRQDLEAALFATEEDDEPLPLYELHDTGVLKVRGLAGVGKMELPPSYDVAVRDVE